MKTTISNVWKKDDIWYLELATEAGPGGTLALFCVGNPEAEVSGLAGKELIMLATNPLGALGLVTEAGFMSLNARPLGRPWRTDGTRPHFSFTPGLMLREDGPATLADSVAGGAP